MWREECINSAVEYLTRRWMQPYFVKTEGIWASGEADIYMYLYALYIKYLTTPGCKPDTCMYIYTYIQTTIKAVVLFYIKELQAVLPYLPSRSNYKNIQTCMCVYFKRILLWKNAFSYVECSQRTFPFFPPWERLHRCRRRSGLRSATSEARQHCWGLQFVKNTLKELKLLSTRKRWQL